MCLPVAVHSIEDFSSSLCLLTDEDKTVGTVSLLAYSSESNFQRLLYHNTLTDPLSEKATVQSILAHYSKQAGYVSAVTVVFSVHLQSVLNS